MSRVYFAQKADSLPGDYCWLVAEDQDRFEISLSEGEIRHMSFRAYKEYFKDKVKKSAFKQLILLQENIKQECSLFLARDATLHEK